jgi:DNA-directed RNA polymerase omega subunit
MASIRTKQLKKGAKPLVQADDNKEVVIALREIAAGYIHPDYPEEAETPSE